MSKIWIFDGKLAVDSLGRPILCDTCPCTPTTCQQCVGMGLWGVLVETEWAWREDEEEWELTSERIVGSDHPSGAGCFLWDRTLGSYISTPGGPNDETIRELYDDLIGSGCNTATDLWAEWTVTEPVDLTYRLFFTAGQTDPITGECLEPDICYTAPDPL